MTIRMPEKIAVITREYLPNFVFLETALEKIELSDARCITYRLHILNQRYKILRQAAIKSRTL